jgi:hypothetical protein
MTMWRRAAAVLVFLLCAAGALPAQHPLLSPALVQAIQDVFKHLDGLSPMSYGRFYTLTVGGKPMTLPSGEFLRRRTGREILESGMSDGGGDNALAAIYLFQQKGYETHFVDSVEISTASPVNGSSGAAAVAVRDPKTGVWGLVNPQPGQHGFYYAFTSARKLLYGRYWIGFDGRLANYPAHDPRSLRDFYRITFNSIPRGVLNERLFQFQFSIDSSLIAPDGRFRNPHLEALLRDNGKLLASYNVHPVNAVAIRLVAGRRDEEANLEYSYQDGWVCTLGLDNACGLGLISYLEERLSAARDRGQLHLIGAPAARKAGAKAETAVAWAQPAWFLWAACGFLFAGLLAVLVWQRRLLAGRETAIAYWLCQVLGWGMFLALAAVGVRAKPGYAAVVVAWALEYFVSGILLSEVLRRYIRRRGWLTLPSRRMLGRFSIAVLVLATLQMVLTEGTILIFDKDARTVGAVLIDWAFTAAIWAAWTSLYVLLTGPRRHREVEVRLQLALREAELRALEAQINPHFLFNCLNSIRGLVIENAARAQDMLTRLANILRYNLRRDIEHTVPLSSEVEIVEDYLALESARFEDRLRVHISIDPDAAGAQVPPMLLQTLVENAIKHGIAPLTAGGDLLIRAAIVGDSVMMEVENPGQIAESAPQATQMGLANIRERLRIVYNGRASLELKNRNGRVAATVVIPRTV